MISTLSQLIAQCESNGRLCAVRWEKLYHPDKAMILAYAKIHPGLSYETLETLMACSWGKFQIMGDNLVRLGLQVPVQAFCMDEALQDIFFLRFCSRAGITTDLETFLNNEGERLHFATKYNGPGNPRGYADRAIAIYNAAKGKT